MKILRDNRFDDYKFIIYSKTEKKPITIKNISIFPLNMESFTMHLTQCAGIITAGGFQTISEALYLHKKLLVIPMKGQPEQKANASILEKMNVPIAKNPDAASLLKWLQDDTNNNHIEMKNDIDKIIHRIMDIGHALVEN
jgi:uncharacterized protein (TIGR00661 family)